jgi:hypothetical protein
MIHSYMQPALPASSSYELRPSVEVVVVVVEICVFSPRLDRFRSHRLVQPI